MHSVGDLFHKGAIQNCTQDCMLEVWQSLPRVKSCKASSYRDKLLDFISFSKSFLFRILQMSSVLNDFSTSAQPYHFSRLSPFPIDIQARELL